MMHTLVDDLDMETMAYRPTIVFLNGEYSGIHNFSERPNNDYLVQHHEVNKDNLDILWSRYAVIQGDNTDYLAMYDFIKHQDMSIQSNYDYAASLMDIENYIQYMISEIYFVNFDWFPSNMKWWRSNNPKTKWRWILYDTDHSFAYNAPYDYRKDMFGIVNNTDLFPSYIYKGLKIIPRYSKINSVIHMQI